MLIISATVEDESDGFKTPVGGVSFEPFVLMSDLMGGVAGVGEVSGSLCEVSMEERALSLSGSFAAIFPAGESLISRRTNFFSARFC